MPRDPAALGPRQDEDLCFLAGDWRILQRVDGHRWSLDDLVTAWFAARDAAWLAGRLGQRAEVVLLGSVASAKYVDVLADVFGAQLRFPLDFVGRGDMSRGGLLLRKAREGVELDYVPVRGAVRHGARPPKLPPLNRSSAGL